MIIGDVLRDVQHRLEHNGIPDSRLEAELLLMTALETDRALLYSNLPDAFPSHQQKALERLLARRLAREPAAYLRGQKEFYGLPFYTAAGVFIPRPETERLVDEALAIARPRISPAYTAADIGTGTGAIAIALATHLPNAQVYAVDISPRALEVAHRNCRRHGMEGRVQLLQGDLLEPLVQPADLLVANLPYIPSQEIATLQPEIAVFEPREALDGGRDGLALIERLLKQAPTRLRPGGACLLEIDPRQSQKALAVAAAAFPRASIGISQDLAGKDRVLLIKT